MTSTADGLPGMPLQGFSLVGGEIWVCGEGACVSDLRFDDWQRYGAGEGYPGHFVFDIEADDDYAYAGTDEGIARFDQYILEWETMGGPAGESLGAAGDVAVGEDRVWFALDGGVAEYRKEAESFRVDSILGQLRSPDVLALRQSARFLWALADDGVARYDKELQSWTSFLPGVDLPAARVRQLGMQGEDLWLGTDAGLWRYNAEIGIWRRDESGDEMPGERVLAFALDSDRIWVVTERAFAVYERETSRWIDYSAAVPLSPDAVLEMAWLRETLVFVGREEIVYGLSQGQDNPSLFTFRSQPISLVGTIEFEPDAGGWGLGLDEAGLELRTPWETDLHLKGGATVYIEDSDQDGASGLGEMAWETRLDLALAGRLGDERSLSGFYDSTDPDNRAYQLSYRGARDDILRAMSAGEIEQQLFNSRLVTGMGLRGGRLRAELGRRSETTRRRLLTADAWVGERRTLSGRDIFFGGNRSVDSQTRDVDYVRGQVFPLPAAWAPSDLRSALIYFDDDDPATDDANTEQRTLAGEVGAWDRLRPNEDYVIGPRGLSLILTLPLAGDQTLVAVAQGGSLPPEDREADLSEQWLRNHYWIAIEPVPGSLSLSIVDSTGASSDDAGIDYLESFGLDADGDGELDPERFSPISGFVNFPDELPFPAEVYGEEPASLFTLAYRYQARLNTFQLSHGDLVPQSERITVDRELLKPDVDYSLIAASGLFVLFEHVLLDDDSVIEVEYLYELGEGSAAATGTEGTVVAGQLGLAPGEHIFLGANATRWPDQEGRDVTTAGLNARFEWKDEQRLLRISPELALSDTEAAAGGGAESERQGKAAGVSLQGRWRKLEVSASQRSLGADFASCEDRRTLLGRLREESLAWGRFDLSRHLQAELEWDRSLSDGVAEDFTFATCAADSGQGDAEGGGWGEESSLTGSLRLLRSGWPNLELRRGRVLLDASGQRQEKLISRVELELSPEQAGISLPGIRRLWLRAFFQRSERKSEAESAELDGEGLRVISPGDSFHADTGGGLPGDSLRADTGGGLPDDSFHADSGGGLHGDFSGDSLRADTGRDEFRDGEVGGGRINTDHAFLRLNGSLGSPLSWNLAFEDRRSFRPDRRVGRKLRRGQEVDATLQAQAHASLDAFLRWEASRDLFWRPEGGPGGFDVNRLLLATVQFYPGRLYTDLSRLSFRFDLCGNETENGEPGMALPGAASLWRESAEASGRRRARNGTVEARVQILPRLRLVERMEIESDRLTREGLRSEARGWRWENRLEIRPSGGLLTLRGIMRETEDGSRQGDQARFSGQWDQAWGRGIITYASLEAQRDEMRDRKVGEVTQLWNPQLRLTWRRTRWQLDASLGGSLTWTRSKDSSFAASGDWDEIRKQSLTASLSLRPLKILYLKLQYVLNRSEIEADASGSGSADGWEIEHDLRLQLQVRA